MALQKDGTFRLDLKYFRHHREDIAYEWHGGEPTSGPLFSPALVDLLGPPRSPDEPIETRHRDLAWATQAVYEQALFHLLQTLQKRYGQTDLALAGACAYNSVANGKIHYRTPFKRIYLLYLKGISTGDFEEALAAG